MRKMFVLSTEPLSDDQERLLLNGLKDDLGWWHHLPNFWIFSDFEGKYNSETLREQIRSVIGDQVAFVVLQANPVQWSGMIRGLRITTSQRDWLNEHWNSRWPLQGKK